MRLGLALPHYDFSLPDGQAISFARMAPYARSAEDAGFDSVWVSDHFFLSLARYGGPSGPSGSLEPLTALAGLTSITRRVQLGTLVVCAQFRHPAVLAKAATALDLLSGGRFELGIGAGWYEDEFRAFGYGFGTIGERFALLEEALEALVLLLPGGPASFQGKRFRLDDAYNHPSPAQRPRPPVWLGAKGGDRSLRLAARHADGWNTVWRWSPEAYGERVRRAREICEEVGRDPDTLRLSLGLFALVGEDGGDLKARFAALQSWMPGNALDRVTLRDFAADTLTGTPDQVLDRLGRFAEMGVEEIIVSPAAIPFALPDPTALEVLAEAILPMARTL